jgi:hypothetical protein
MRVIEEKMNKALAQGKNWSESNTAVICNEYGKFVRLYNTLIYAKVNGVEYFSDGGWSTATTSSRLRALGAAYSTNDRKNKCKLTPQGKIVDLFRFGK